MVHYALLNPFLNPSPFDSHEPIRENQRRVDNTKRILGPGQSLQR